MIINSCKEYRKLDPNIRQAVDMCIKKLQKRYNDYQKQNISIANLFGDGNIIHDIIDNEFYVYKSQFKGIQVRLLYKVDENDNIDVVYFYTKNGNHIVNIKGSIQQRYISLFENFVNNLKKEYA